MELKKMNIEEILQKHIDDEGKFDHEAAAKELKEVQGKEFVPKTEFNTKNEALKQANNTLEELRKENKDVEALQTKISDYETKATELEKELVNERKTFAIKEALQGAGAQDIDYTMFKLGDVEVDEEGKVKDLENKVKELKEANPTFFTPTNDTKDDDQTTPPAGFEVFDNKLDDGKEPDPTAAAVRAFEEAVGIKSE